MLLSFKPVVLGEENWHLLSHQVLYMHCFIKYIHSHSIRDDNGIELKEQALKAWRSGFKS